MRAEACAGASIRLWIAAGFAVLNAGCMAAGNESELSSVAGERKAETVSTEFAQLVSQPVRWIRSDVTIEAARVVRARSDREGTASKTYVELALELDLRGSMAVFVNDATWDLQLANGLTLAPIDAEHVTLLTTEAPRASVTRRYPVEGEVDLRGAKLILNGDERTLYEPEAIPLDREYPQAFPRRIGALVGQAMPYEHADVAGLVRIDEALYDIDAIIDQRALRGRRTVSLRLAFGPGARSEIEQLVNPGQAGVSLRAGGDIVVLEKAPVFTDLDPNHVTIEFEIEHEVDRFELVLGDGAMASERRAVELADSVLAADVP